MVSHWNYEQGMYCIENQNGERVIFKKGEGAYLYDAANKSYIDLWNGFGSVTLGYNDPDVIAGVEKIIAEKSFSLQSPTRYLPQLSELILEDYPEKDSIALFPGGTDAVKAAALIALNFTGKDIILSSGYHGWDPMWGMGQTPFMPNPAGVIDFFFIEEKLEELAAIYADRVAAVIISPDLSYFSQDYYHRIYDICKKYKFLTIIDDVKCGYRYNIGASIRREIFPADIYIVSKGIANGARISCVIGAREVMKQGGDFCFTSFYDVTPLISAICTVTKIKKYNTPEKIREMGDRFIKESFSVINSLGLPITISGNGNLFQFIFGDDQLADAFYRNSAEHGLSFYKGDNQCPSYAFDEATLTEASARMNKVLVTLQKQFGPLLQTKIPPAQLYMTAYNQTDGCLEEMPFEEKIKFVNGLYEDR